MNESNASQRYDAQDYAFLDFAKKKGFKYGEIAEAVGRSKSSVVQKGWQIKCWTKGTIPPETRAHKLITKAMQLSFAVNSNVQGEQYRYWMKKLYATRNVEYKITPQNDDVTTPIEESVEEPVQKEVEIAKKHEPLLSLTINTDSFIAIIRAWRGN